jgi:GATA-binding protein
VPGADFPSTDGLPGRMSDQAAAETLVAVGRQERVGTSGEEMDEDESPRRKRPRKARASEAAADIRRGRSRRGGRGADDEAGDEDDEEERMRTRKRSREAHAQWDASPEQPDDARYGFGHPLPARTSSFTGVAPGLPTHTAFAGLDLPPLTAVLNPALSGLYAGAIPPGFGGAPPSYLRSGSVPSRTDSPMGVHGGPPPGAYVLPPMHGAHLFGRHSPPGTRSRSPGVLPRGPFDMPVLSPPVGIGGAPAVPTLPQLEHHYRELGDHRRRLVEMLERTDAIMAGVKRGLDEMRSYNGPNGHHTQPPPLPATMPGPPASMPLVRDRERRDGTVWPISTSPVESRA